MSIETGAEEQSITEGLIRDATTVEGDLEAQEAIMVNESLQQEFAGEQLGPTLEHHAYERRSTEVPTSDSAGVVEDMSGSSTAPVGSASGGLLGKEGVPELVGKQDLEVQEQEAGSLSRYPTEALDPRMPGVTRPDQFATARESPRGFVHINHAVFSMAGETNMPASGFEAAVEAIRQVVASCNSLLPGETRDEPSGTTALGAIDLKHPLQATVDATTSKVVSGKEATEVDVVASKAPDQSAVDLLQTEQYSIAGNENIQPAHAGIVGALPKDTSSAGDGLSLKELSPQQRPSLAATNGWLRIEIPAHFSAVRNQLYFYKSMEEMQSAPKATGKRPRPNARTSSARKIAKVNLDHTSGGKAKDSKSGETVSSSSASISQETPRNTRAQHGDSYGRASEAEEEVMLLLTDPLETNDVRLGSQGEGTADEDQESGPSAPGAHSFKELAAYSIGDSTNSAAVAEPAAGRVTRRRNRGRGSGRGQRGH
ncbi:hypothetical protein SLS53_008528 [Cytospora paraplurivora]|uniref:Uncharacterized protein n=1 Tax=Cytospora paraplurivora TaxID=2898453 RepID=A0AAN9U021_9PEZI